MTAAIDKGARMNGKASAGRSLIGIVLILLCVSRVAASNEQLLREASELSAQINELHNDGRYQDALPLAKRALEIRRQELGSEHLDTAASSNQLGRLYFELAAYAEAEAFYQQALAIRVKVLGPQHPDTARSLNNLAGVYVKTGAYAKAEKTYLHAIAILKKALGPDHPDIAVLLRNLGGLHADVGAYDKAEPLLQRAVEILTNALGPEHAGTMSALDNLAAFYQRAGEPVKAEPLLEKVLAIREKLLRPNHPSVAFTLNSLGNVYFDTGAYSRAQLPYERALEIREAELGPAHPDTAMSMHNLAATYAELDGGRLDRAVPMLQRAIEINEQALGPRQAITAEPMVTLANLYARSEAFDRAESWYTRALSIQKEALGPNHPYVAGTLTSYAKVYEHRHDYAQAQALYKQAIAIFDQTVGAEYHIALEARSGLAMTLWAAGDRSAALSQLSQVQVASKRSADRFLLTTSEARSQAYMQRLATYVHQDVSFSMDAANRDGVLLGVTSVLQYKGRVLDAISGSVARFRKSLGSGDRVLLDELSQVANQLSALTYQDVNTFEPNAYRERSQQLERRQEQLQAELARRSSAFRSEIKPSNLASVQREIPQDTLLLEWIRYESPDLKLTSIGKTLPRYGVYVIKHEGDPLAVDVGDAQVIEAAVAEYRRLLEVAGASGMETPRRRLSQLLLGRVYPHLRPAKRLLMAPDGALSLVPMGALEAEDGKYLLQSFEIAYLTSGRDLLRLASTPAARRAPVVVADPAYGARVEAASKAASQAVQLIRSADLDRSGLQFRRLTDGLLEAQALKSLMGLDDSSVLTGAYATEARLKSLSAPSILHVATHGFFLSDQQLLRDMTSRSRAPGGLVATGENPLLRSGLALAGANLRRSGKEDGILTALEMAQLDLQGTQLVVLSACDTGIGEVRNGEGIYGLRRALVLAGAQAQVSTLWKVADVSTREFMVRYYELLLRGEGRAAALRHAQQDMLSKPTRAHPYYWAAFVHAGSWAPIAVAN